MLLSYLVLSLLLSSLLILSIFFFSAPSPVLGFLLSFWLNKLVSLMSSDTSRSQSQLPNNKMAVTLCLSTICVSLFQLSLPQPLVRRTPALCRSSQGFVSDHFGLLL